MLRDLIRTERDEILRRFAERLRAGPFETDELSRSLLLDGLPIFFDRLAAGLHAVARPEDQATIGTPGETGTEHGQQRFELGFDVVAVAREWAILRDVILELVIDRQLPLQLVEYRLLSRHVSQAAIEAIEQHVVASDQARLKLAAQHVGFLVHDLRNQLAGASAALTWWKRDPAQGSTVVPLLERSLEELVGILDRELTVARLDSLRGGIELSSGTIDVTRLVELVASDARPAAALRDVRVVVAIEPGLEVQGDQRLLRSALGNLVGNAVKFTGEATQVRIHAHRAGGLVAIEVHDACGGIPEGVRDRLFQVHAGADHERTGFGLGTAIARQAVEAHGGLLTVEDQPGVGCTFRISLPQA